MPKRILLLEDHDDFRRAFRMVLEAGGCAVADYASAEAAAREFLTCDADVAFLDVRLPGRGGDDFGRELLEKCPRTKIVFVTGEADVETLKRKVPGCHALRKPVNFNDLFDLIDSD